MNTVYGSSSEQANIEPQRLVAKKMGILQERITVLASVVENLHKSLQPVIVETVCKDTRGDVVKAVEICPMADELQNRINGIDQIIEIVQYLHTQLQV